MPLHFTGFHPDYKLSDVPPTPPSTLRRARAQGQAAGLRYVYTGNVHDADGDTTSCPRCKKKVVERDWYQILSYGLRPDGSCSSCGEVIPGRFDAGPGHFGRRRFRIAV